ncbi:DUF1963 domain-containing protein [uncultured Chryseobacterium sp.]|uniref:YwqG family protein n=1 Tax=uncultured Chryseobacterium sp. TaxID=259322 RepID=UPI0025FBDFA8|nr:DUF1963 domain-containing protein [uncultured Chryseobacterium sp.]
MIPKFLNKFKADLERFRMETIKIQATPVSDEESVSITGSKFLGKPYLPKNTEYPKDQNSKPMILWAQINFSEVPNLQGYPSSGILQLYASSDNWYDTTDYKIMFHEDTVGDVQNDFSFLTKDLYEDSPINKEHRLSFIKDTEFGGATDYRFSMQFDGLDFYEYQDTLSVTEQEEMDKIIDGSGHRIGGYAYFTQSDPRYYSQDKKDDILLLQIDTDDEIMFGDSGVAHLFINPKDLVDKKFEKAWFNWDCF